MFYALPEKCQRCGKKGLNHFIGSPITIVICTDCVKDLRKRIYKWLRSKK